MTIDDIQLLYEYDRWANSRAFESVSSLSVELFTRDLGGSFRSVRDTMVHVISGEWIWVSYCKAQSHGSALETDLKTRRETLFNPDAFPDVAAVQSKWAEVEQDQVAFLNGLTNASLEKMLPARGTQLSLAQLMQHVANHSTYHRGQIALMVRQLGGEPLATDFHVFLAEGRGEGAAKT